VEKLGKYEIVDKIGVGGFGVVYRGYDPFIKRHVAIKTCSAEDRETRDRFMREAEIAGNLQHRHIVTVFEFGFHGEIPYLVQEFLSGEDLDHKIRRGDAIPIAEKVKWLAEVARGLEFAHSRGVVHRDIKPANIRVLDDGSAKILDFGIAKLAQQQSTLTQAGVTLGTASYLAPEQIRGEGVDVRTDIFSFGVLAYELLTYERPFRAQEISATFYKILNERPAAVAGKAPGTPPELEQVVLRCLEKDPAKRFSPTGDLVKALERLDRRTTSTFRPGDDARVSDARQQAMAEEKTSALKPPPMSMASTASSPIPIPVPPPARPPAASGARPAVGTSGPRPRPNVALGEMELETPKSGPRPESFGMSPASLGRRGSRWPKVVGGTIAALVVAAAALVLAGPSIPGFDKFLAATFGKTGGAAPAEPEPATPVVEATPTKKSATTRPKSSGSKSAAKPAATAPAAAAPAEPEPSPTPAEAAPVAGAPAGDPAAVPAPAAAPPPPPAPKPATLVVGPAWDTGMTLRVASKRYRLDREHRIELEAGTYSLDFELQSPSYRFDKASRLKLAAGETERAVIPIQRPGRLSVQPHLNTRPGNVRIDGQMAGPAPVRGRWLEPGQHAVEVFAVAGGGVTPALAQSIEIKSGVETIVSFDVDGRVAPTIRERPIEGS
jgi:serine/threonine-protein kinase